MHDNEIQHVIDGIIEVLEKGTIPMFVPPNYRAALRELAEARGDRVGSRKHKFEQAVKKLQPVLDAVSASPLSRQLDGKLVAWHQGEVYDVGRLLANWRMLCSCGPAELPTPKEHMKFEFTYVAEGGESVAEVARRAGYDNPGPLCHYPYDYSPYIRLKKDDKLFVPWPPRLLNSWIAAYTKLREKWKEGLEEGIEKQLADKERMESLFVTIEAVQILANVSAGGVFLAHQIEKATSVVTARYSAKMWHEVYHMVAEQAGHSSAEIVHAALEPSHAPKSKIRVLLYHGLGVLSATYWASVITSWLSGEPEAAEGPGGIADKRIAGLKRQAERDQFDLNLKIQNWRAQLESPIYKYRVTL